MKTNKPYKFIEFNLPVYYASYLINCDPSGLEDNEIELINDWCNKMVEIHESFYCVSADVENTYFSPFNDLPGMRNMGSDICKFTFIIDK